MRTFFKILFFILSFQMEVRVRASVPVAMPKNCFGRMTPCSFKVTEEKWFYSSGSVKLHATSGSIFTEIEKNKEWKLIEGALWVENAPSLRVKSVTSEAEGSSGQYWVIAEKSRTIYRNISARLVIRLKDQKKVEVPKGFEIWVGAVNSESEVEHGMIEPINLKSHLRSWGGLYSGKKEQFLSEVQDIKDQWADRVEQSGEIYKKVTERNLAAIEDKKRMALEKRSQQEQERLRIREEFRRKVFEY